MDEEKNKSGIEKAADLVEDKFNEDVATTIVVTKAASGDVIGAAKDAIKSGILKKRAKRYLIKYALILFIIIFMVTSDIGVLNGIKDEMINLITSSFSSIKGFWARAIQKLTNDYWIDLKDTDQEYIIDLDTGKTIAYVNEDGKKIVTNKELLKDLVEKQWPDEDKSVNDLTDDELISLTEEFLKDKDTTTKKYNIIDSYVKQLGDQGISIKDLRLLGNADYENPDEILEDEENKQKVEKYIAEFLRADIISQQMHKRYGTDKTLVDPNNEYLVDGGVYLYRTTSSSVINLVHDDLASGSYTKNERTTSEDYKKVEYLPYDEFMEKINNNDSSAKYYYAIDQDDNLVVSEVTTKTKGMQAANANSDWFEGLGSQKVGDYGTQIEQTVEITAKTIPYKEYIAKYIMPYEFLINLCQITQNPEFVYHVAMLARNTDIALVLHDNITIDKVVEEVYKETAYFKNYDDDSTSGATESSNEATKGRTIYLTTTETPVLSVKYADTWSFYDEFDHIIKTEGTLTTQGPTDITPELPDTLPTYHEEKTDVEGNVIRDEYWDNSEHKSDFVVKKEQALQNITITASYEEVQSNSIEKSKQFLGLLRNETGECPNECYSDTPIDVSSLVQDCAEKAEFDLNGKNVMYHIPGQTKLESPLNKLASGLDMLYSLMQANSSGYNQADKILSDENLHKEYFSENGIYNSDGRSAYVVKLQGIVEHLRYLKIDDLQNAPENEEYYKKFTIYDTANGTNDYWGSNSSSSAQINLNISSDLPWEIWQAAIREGFSEEAAAGILGNIEAESDFDPECFNPAGGGHGAYGLAQWRSDRQLRLKEYAATEQVPPAIQIAYLMGEIKGDGRCNSLFQAFTSYKRDYNNWLNATTPEDAANAFMRWFERPGFKESTKRAKMARTWYEKYKGKEVSKLGEMPDIPAGTQTVAFGNRTYIEYKQMDYPSKTPSYQATYGGGKGSIAEKGCMPTSITIISTGFNITDKDGKLFTPPAFVEQVHNYISSSETAAIAMRKIGLTVGPYTSTKGNAAAMLEHLNKGFPILVHAYKGSYYTKNGHYMTLLAADGENVYLSNPGNRDPNYTGWINIHTLIARGVDWYETVSMDEGKEVSKVAELNKGHEGTESYKDNSQIGYTSTFKANGRTYKNWKQYPLDGSTGTGWAKWLKSSGCGLTSASIILGAKDSSITPYYLYHYANGREKTGSVNIRRYITDAGASYTVARSLNDVKNGLQSGKPVIICLLGNTYIDGIKWSGPSGHYIALLDISEDGSQVYVSNPGANPSHKNGWVPLSKFSGKAYFEHTYIISL